MDCESLESCHICSTPIARLLQGKMTLYTVPKSAQEHSSTKSRVCLHHLSSIGQSCPFLFFPFLGFRKGCSFVCGGQQRSVSGNPSTSVSVCSCLVLLYFSSGLSKSGLWDESKEQVRPLSQRCCVALSASPCALHRASIKTQSIMFEITKIVPIEV
jgi:hypothetical protein